jgi:hypothetical protein
MKVTFYTIFGSPESSISIEFEVFDQETHGREKSAVFMGIMIINDFNIL